MDESVALIVCCSLTNKYFVFFEFLSRNSYIQQQKSCKLTLTADITAKISPCTQTSPCCRIQISPCTQTSPCCRIQIQYSVQVLQFQCLVEEGTTCEQIQGTCFLLYQKCVFAHSMKWNQHTFSTVRDKWQLSNTH